MDSEKSINSFEMEKEPDYLSNNFFTNFLIASRHYYYAKQIFLTFLIWLIFFRFLLYREVLKF